MKIDPQLIALAVDLGLKVARRIVERRSGDASKLTDVEILERVRGLEIRDADDLVSEGQAEG